MKKHFYFCMTVIMIVVSTSFFSCNEKSEPVIVATASATGNIDHLRLFFEGLHPSDQVRMFNGFPAQLKFSLIDSHLRSKLKDAKNDDERNFIQSLIDHLKPEYYSDSLALQKDMPWFAAQKDLGLKAFKNDTARLVEVLYNIGGDRAAKPLVDDPSQENCECYTKDDYCVFGDCEKIGCEEFLTGCGTFGAFPCDGMCASK
jgi:hypothetical protein